MKNKKKKGFTLIELVIVIAIIAILAAIALPRYNKSKQRAAEAAHKSNVQMLRSAGVLRQSDMKAGDPEVTWTKGKGDYGQYLEKWPELPVGIKFNNDIKEYKVTINPTSVKVSPDENEFTSIDNKTTTEIKEP